jgi:radical SAM protein with 4Fe4S-binding SPASM domain
VIRHDGALLMCCADLHSELVLGNLHESTFAELWQGERATRLRLDHLAGRFEGVCAGCGGINWYDTTEAMRADARRRGRLLGLLKETP